MVNGKSAPLIFAKFYSEENERIHRSVSYWLGKISDQVTLSYTWGRYMNAFQKRREPSHRYQQIRIKPCTLARVTARIAHNARALNLVVHGAMRVAMQPQRN